MLIVIAQYTARPGTGDEVAEVLTRHAASSAAEPGCLQFTAHRSLDQPDHFLLYEAYVDEDAFEAHRSSPHFKTNIEATVVPRLSERQWSRFVAL